jgi:hypothetical protein
MSDLDELATAVAEADSVVTFTGAGVSTASGIPDFRSEDGLWSTSDQTDFSLRAFTGEPAAFWQRWLETHAEILAEDVTPNSAHEALARLEAGGVLDGAFGTAGAAWRPARVHRERAPLDGAGRRRLPPLARSLLRATCRDPL